MADQAAVDIPGDQQHRREPALRHVEVERQRGDRPGQEGDDLAHEDGEDERAPRCDRDAVDAEAPVGREERDGEDPQQPEDRVERKGHHDEKGAREDKNQDAFLKDQMPALLRLSEPQVIKPRSDDEPGAEDHRQDEVLPELGHQ